MEFNRKFDNHVMWVQYEEIKYFFGLDPSKILILILIF